MPCLPFTLIPESKISIAQILNLHYLFYYQKRAPHFFYIMHPDNARSMQRTKDHRRKRSLKPLIYGKIEYVTYEEFSGRSNKNRITQRPEAVELLQYLKIMGCALTKT